MIDLELINTFNIDELETYKIELNKDDLIKILDDVNKNKFNNNTVDFISFQLYKNKSFIVIISEGFEFEGVMNIKKFDCLNKEYLFKEVSFLRKNEIQNYINNNDKISRIYITLNYDLFKYVAENISNTFVIQIDNTTDITVKADDVTLPIKSHIYLKQY